MSGSRPYAGPKRCIQRLSGDFRNPAGDAVGGLLEGIVSQMSVARGVLHLVVALPFSDHGQAFPDQETAAGV